MATSTNNTPPPAKFQPASVTSSPCSHCGGLLRSDFWDPDILTCCQCARQVFSFERPLAKPRRRGPKPALDWTPEMVDRLLALYQDESLRTVDVARLMQVSEGAVRNKVRHLRWEGHAIRLKTQGRKPGPQAKGA